MATNNYIFDIALSLLYRTSLRSSLQLLDRFGSAEEAWRHLDEPEMEACWHRAEQEAEWIERHGIRVFTLADDDYPYRLRQCPDRPLVLYAKGHVRPSEGHIVSIVGTRQATERGREMTNALVRDLGQQLAEVTIVSGGAYGIDIAAHRAALQYHLPTIIVPAHGLDRIYPSQHRPEAVASLEQGGLLTEHVSGTEPFAPYFVQRNRIVAGLADAVVVVESKARGGSLITARMAGDYDRELFAFPGRPTDVNAQGCNRLIATHQAQLITGADELIERMQWTTRNTVPQPVQTKMTGLMAELTERQARLAQLLQESEEGIHINLLVMETGGDYAAVASDLVLMEMQSLVRSLPGGIYRIVR